MQSPALEIARDAGVALVKLRAITVEFDLVDPFVSRWRFGMERRESRLYESRQGATSNPFQLPSRLQRQGIPGFVLVRDPQLIEGQRHHRHPRTRLHTLRSAAAVAKRSRSPGHVAIPPTAA